MRSRLLWMLMCGVALSGCNPQAPANHEGAAPSPSARPTSALPPLKFSASGTSLRPVRFVSQKNNRKQYELLAHSYLSNGAAGSAKATFRDVHVTFFDRDGSKLEADAPRAVLDQSANTVTLLDGVHAKNGSGMTLACDTLVYSRSTEMLHGQGNIIATGPSGLRATGNTLDSDISLTHTRMQ